jgi:glycosyltransferase involved in cell wall biosynthesis
VDEKFCRLTDRGYLKAVKEKYKLPDRFILYVGSLRRHKNIDTLLKSFTTLSKKISDIWLVMVGKPAHKFDLKKERVLYLGEVADDRELVGIYNLASCFCNLSLFEGFGLTILEAQAVGIPVVASAIPAHLEIGGEGVSIVSPHDIDQICITLYNVLTNSELRESLINGGFNNVKRFDCKNSAQRTFEIYKEVAGEQSV